MPLHAAGKATRLNHLETSKLQSKPGRLTYSRCKLGVSPDFFRPCDAQEVSRGTAHLLSHHD
jgi:hypothetical protein